MGKRINQRKLGYFLNGKIMKILHIKTYEKK